MSTSLLGPLGNAGIVATPWWRWLGLSGPLVEKMCRRWRLPGHAYSQPRRKLILARARGGRKVKMEGLANAAMNAAARGTGIDWAVQSGVRNAAQKNGRDDELR